MKYGVPYSEEELTTLIQMYKTGLSTKEMMERLDRTYESVRSKLRDIKNRRLIDKLSVVEKRAFGID